MKVEIEPGKYVLAVSGGVDSMVLLDILSGYKHIELVVAHFNHGMRVDSDNDERLIQKVANNKGLTLEVGSASLGAGASEEEARNARYNFLRQVMLTHEAKAIVTAHHQDDLIETAFINLLRGTNRRGLTSIADSAIVRPLLSTPKVDILAYAQKNRLNWLEDATNSDTTYLRNYLRLKVLNNLSFEERKSITGNIDKVAIINKDLNKEIATLSKVINKNGIIDRSKFISLPQEIASELMAEWLRSYGVADFDKKTLNRMTLALKTAKANSEQPVKRGLKLEIGKKTAHFTTTVQTA